MINRLYNLARKDIYMYVIKNTGGNVTVFLRISAWLITDEFKIKRNEYHIYILILNNWFKLFKQYNYQLLFFEIYKKTSLQWLQSAKNI